MLSTCGGVGLESPQAPGPLTRIPGIPKATPTKTSGYVKLLNEQASINFPDGSMGLARLAGNNPSWTQDIPFPLVQGNYPLQGLVLTIFERLAQNNGWQAPGGGRFQAPPTGSASSSTGGAEARVVTLVVTLRRRKASKLTPNSGAG
jgi:hypothetical protein